uniref:NADH dehydrogenase subunit 9 n=1 Tax=Synura synuroidea TaxID=47573 RepID=Q9MGA7_9STRA|nr:NADH dehydrogenase subunit 9 [Synura synuroidea]AAF36942.1 NADH dehydrogenase subunit 9 [Synura synuroidea]
MYKTLKKIIPFIFFQKINNEDLIILLPKNLRFSLLCLKKHINYQFSLLSYIAGVDLLGCKYRFCVVYDLLSLSFNIRLRIKLFITEVNTIPSVTDIYVNSNWWEREVWDLFGIYFENHPDLRRILTDYGFEGYPMRKDFPLYGYTELRYDESKKQIVVESVELSQNFRLFEFEMPWQ